MNYSVLNDYFYHWLKYKIIYNMSQLACYIYIIIMISLIKLHRIELLSDKGSVRNVHIVM